MSDAFPLSPVQEQVLTLIAGGATAMNAAKQAGVHRNTVGHWLRKPDFKQSLDEARARKEIFFRDQAETLAAIAIAGLIKLSDDPQASPNVRLKACTILFEKAIMFMPDSAAIVIPGSSDTAGAAPGEPPADQPEPVAPAEPENVQPMHNCAQDPAPEPRPVAKSAQSSPKTADVDLCPCGSGLPFDRCCIGRTPLKLA